LHLAPGARGRDAGGFSLEVAFEAPPGITVLFGPSGCGKSTTLAAIAGLVRPTRGRVALGSEAWLDTESGVDVPVTRRGVAFVFQSLALFPHLTAAQNVAYGMARGLARSDRLARATELLERLRVPHLADRRPPTFSGGEAQRVALARALATRPRAVLLDEPFTALDRPLRRDLLADVGALVSELDVPAVLVTHDREEALGLAGRVAILQRGRVVRTGTVDEAVAAGLLGD
jgi:molybdate transport system ATP-binding protein